MTAQVLIADDEAQLREAFCEKLELKGITALAAADGVEALELLNAHDSITLLVTDIRMPRMDGYDLVEQALALRPALKVMMMSGYSTDPERSASLRARGIKTVFKPMALGSMADMVLQMLRA